MKKCLKIFLSLGLFSFLIPTALAQESKDPNTNQIAISKTVHCAPTTEVLTSLDNDYEEEAFIMGGEASMMTSGQIAFLPTMLYLNPTTQTYTVLQAPILGEGTGSPMEGKLCVLTAGRFAGVNKEVAAKLLALGEKEEDSNTPQTSPIYEYHPDVLQANFFLQTNKRK